MDPLGNRTTREYDLVSRLIRQVDPRGKTTRFAYDPLNRLTQIRDPLGGVTTFTYDPNGNLLTVTDAKGNTTSHTYDTMDRLLTRTDPLGRVESYQYDGMGNLTQFTDRKGQVSTFVYDALNRRTRATFGDGAFTEFVYDAAGRLATATDSLTGAITEEYDTLNRLVRETTPQGSIQYGYDASGRRTTMTVNGQAPVAYAYDAASRLRTIAQSSLLSPVTLDYDASGRRTLLRLPNGVTTAYDYDTASRLTRLTYTSPSALLGDLTYQYDPAGNRTSVGGSFARTLLPDPVTSATYDVANRHFTFGSQSPTYDANGNLTSDGTNTYTWNARNQLTGISGGVTASFVYDGLGRRKQKTVNGTVTEFVYDALSSTPVQETSGATVRANILTGLGFDEYLARSDSAGPAYFLPDGLGSTLALADSAGTVQTSYTYEPFGKTTTSGPASANFFQFTSRENDSTGLYYYRARYYHPGLQRFISEDPIGFYGGDINLYTYVGNNPTTYVDPWGLTHVERLNKYRDLREACRVPGNCFPPSPPPPPKGSKSGEPPKNRQLPTPCDWCRDLDVNPVPRGCTAGAAGICLPGGKPVPRYPDPDMPPSERGERTTGEIIKQILRRIFGGGGGDPDA